MGDVEDLKNEIEHLARERNGARNNGIGKKKKVCKELYLGENMRATGEQDKKYNISSLNFLAI